MADSIGRLLAWYDAERRELPWRVDTDPYRVWVSEIMLQQTTVAAVVPYFERWMRRFPDVAALAEATEEEALSIWQGLGYYRRCRNLRDAAKIVSRTGWPVDLSGWMSLPGVGAYTAGAVCSIAFGLRVPAVDGNVERIYARVCGDRSLDLKKPARTWAAALVLHDRPGDLNQALMDLGAMVCRPADPRCECCPISALCTAFQESRQASLPTSRKSRRPVELHHVVWVPCYDGRFGVRRINEGEWWEGMYEFPRCDATHMDALQRLRGMGRRSGLCSFRHTVTHHRITVDAKLVRAREMSDELLWVDEGRLAELPMPAPQRKIAECALRALRRPSSAEIPPASPKTRPPQGSRSRAAVPADGS